MMSSQIDSTITRRGLLSAFAATAVVPAPVFANATGYVKGAGSIRKLSMFSKRLGENVNTVYWIDGEYIDEAIFEISKLMRDWRQNEVKLVDRRTIDIIAASQTLLETSQPFQLLSGYRSPRTNAMLRRQSRSVARKSLHMTAQAADLRMSGRSVRQISRAALSCRSGGVGRYSRSNFVHMDCGPLRTWGR